MGIKITIGNPNRWRRWVSANVPKTGSPIDRPSPGTWFFEARFHHTGSWKIGLDFRPVDGAMPDLWVPPFMWRPAHEIAEVEKQLQTLGGIAALMGHEPTVANLGIIDGWVKTYGEMAKKGKKLLFGSAEGAGAHAHTIKAVMLDNGDLVAGPDGTKDMSLPVLDTETLGPLHGLGHGKGLSTGAELISKHAGSTPTPLMYQPPAEPLDFTMPEWKVQGLPIPYNPVLFKEKMFKWDVEVELVGAQQALAHARWDCEFSLTFKAHGGIYSRLFNAKIDFHMLKETNHNILPVIEVVSVVVKKFKAPEIVFDVYLKYASEGGETVEVTLSNEKCPGLFPMDGGLGALPYTVWNQQHNVFTQTETGYHGIKIVTSPMLGDDQFLVLTDELKKQIMDKMGVPAKLLG